MALTTTTALILGGLLGAGGAAAGGAFGGDDKGSEGGGTTPAAPAETGSAVSYESVDTQSAQRRLARLSKYFTSPTGVLDAGTGSSGVF